MIRHIVMWKLRDPAEAPRFKELLDGCRGIVPGMLEFDVGLRTGGLEANMDVVLVSTFADAAALEAYLHHPKHKEAGTVLGGMRESRTVLDFEVPGPASASGTGAAR
ncbi:Dabb family protein [Caldimonas tepidiphila]|uniref:Dabb family protein n=1 Tax=Caldimonas tepidiphila TaxID=2315841 RepID=UPI000E5B0508|nr:Dabb family protein [Caldimonas tepidiphila]